MAADAHGTWEDLFWHIEKGDYATKYAIGEMIPLTLTDGKSFNMEIIAFDADTDYDSSELLPVTMLSFELYPATMRFNPAYVEGQNGTGNIGGWPECELRQWINENVWPCIPLEIARNIHAAKKYSAVQTVEGSTISNAVTSDKIWIPSGREFGSTRETLGPKYSAFANSATKRSKKTANGTSYHQHLRTCYWNNTQIYYVPKNPGLLQNGSVTTARSFCFGFCIGKSEALS